MLVRTPSGVPTHNLPDLEDQKKRKHKKKRRQPSFFHKNFFLIRDDVLPREEFESRLPDVTYL